MVATHRQEEGSFAGLMMDEEGSPRSIDVMAGSFDTGVIR
jgi:hypothetical protein